mgnify:CR=1 FL=1
MTECPVCRAPLFGRPDTCDECLSPLSAQSDIPTGWARLFTLLFPGVGHLWRFYLLSGMIASFLSLLGLIVGIQVFQVSDPLIFSLVFGIIWVLWIVFWSWHIRDRRRRYVTIRTVAGTVIGLLLLVNFSMLINLILLSLGWGRL